MDPIDIASLFQLEKALRGTHPENLRWLDDERYVEYVLDETEADAGGAGGGSDADGASATDPAADAVGQLHVVDAVAGESRPLVDVDTMQAALAALDGVDQGTAEKLARRRSYRFLDGDASLLISHEGALYRYDIETNFAARLGGDGEVVGARPSPDGEQLAFVRDHDLYVMPSTVGAATRLTHDGAEETLNGRLDWVYQEEIYGRGDWNGFWWSPDSQRLAFLQLDESPVDTFRVEDHIPTRGKQELWRYPKSGRPNPNVRVGCVAADGGDVVWVDLGEHGGEERLVVAVGWTPQSDEIVLQVADRTQTYIDVLFADPSTGAVRFAFREQPGKWVYRSGIEWLDDDTFLWSSTRDGWKHLYRYHRSGKLVGQLTEGDFDVFRVYPLQPGADTLYIASNEGGILERHLWAVPVDGSSRRRVTEQTGTHTSELSPGGVFAVDRWARTNDPGATDLIELPSGKWMRSLGSGSAELLTESSFIEPEFLQIEGEDGFAIEAALVRPPGYRRGRKYPVLVYTYGGPNAPVVRENWVGQRLLIHSELARRGYLVLSCDPQSASGKGQRNSEVMYRRAGETELRDIETCIDWLVAEAGADPERVGIFGWSYGGFMASYSLTHSERFKVGIAGAPVTDWANYDSIYTERYMSTPEENPEGYDAANVVEAAADLHGELLLIHGTMDENVHMSNSLQLAYALQKAGKPFRFMLYPKNRHGITEKPLDQHLWQTITDFLLERL